MASGAAESATAAVTVPLLPGVEHGEGAALAGHLAAALDKVVAACVLHPEKHSIIIAVSGGSLPKILGQALRLEGNEAAERLRATAHKWHVVYVDERVVPLTAEDSNHRTMKEELDGEDWASSITYHPIDPSLGVKEAAAAYERDIKAIAGSDFAIDVALLGMGPDGHTASLFPGHDLLSESSVMVAPISDSPKPPPERVTLTLPAINGANNVFFVSTGAGKAEALRKVAMQLPAAITEETLPAARIRPTSGNLKWFLDDALFLATYPPSS